MAAGATYEPIATQTLGSNTTEITFSSIPATYTDLVLIFNTKFVTAQSLTIRLNSDTGSNYSNTQLYGTGTSALSTRNTGNAYMFLAAISTEWSTNILNFMNYSNATTNKTVLVRQSPGNTDVAANIGLWRSTAAITSISVQAYTTTTNFVTGSTFTLYGIAAA